MEFPGIPEQKFIKYIVDDIRQSSPALNAWLEANGPPIDLDCLILQLCDRCVNGGDDERCQSLRSLTQIQRESRAQRVHLTKKPISDIVQALQRATAITESNSCWNRELVDALGASGAMNAKGWHQPGLTVSLLLELHGKLVNPDEQALVFQSIRTCGRDAASASVPVLAQSLRSNSDNVVLESLTTLGWLEEDGRQAVAGIAEVIIGESRDRKIAVNAAAALVKCLTGNPGNCLDGLSRDESAKIIDTLRELGNSDVASEARSLRQILENRLLDIESTAEPASDRPEYVVEFKSYYEFGLGIHFVGGELQYRLFTPCPEHESVVRVDGSTRVILNGERFLKLFNVLSDSKDGRTAPRKKLMEEFGILKKMKRAVHRQQNIDDPDNSPVVDETEMQISAEAYRRLANAMATLGSSFREKVNVKSHCRGAHTFEVTGGPDCYQSAFVVRALTKNKYDKFTFG